MEAQGEHAAQGEYVKAKVTISLLWANLFAVLVLILCAVVFGFLFYLVRGMGVGSFDPFQFLGSLPGGALTSGIVLILGLIIGTIVHELIHGITWAIFAKDGFKSIRFGVIWKMLAPYCHCKEPLVLRHYVLGAIMPAILVGIVPTLLAVAMGSLALLGFGVFFIAGASGDFLIIHALRNEKKGTLVEDHPSEAGCYVYRFDAD